MSTNWFVTKDVKPENRMPRTNWFWVVDPCDLCPKSSSAECKSWEACTRKKRDHPNPNLRRVKKSELNPKTDFACVMQSNGGEIAWDSNTKCWVPCDQCWNLAQCVLNHHVLERKPIAFLDVKGAPGVTPAKRACKSLASWVKPSAQEFKTPGKDSVGCDHKRARPSPGKPSRPPTPAPARDSRIDAPQRNLVANTDKSIRSSSESGSSASAPPNGVTGTKPGTSGLDASSTLSARASQKTLPGNRLPARFSLSSRPSGFLKFSAGTKFSILGTARQASSAKYRDNAKHVTWDSPRVSNGVFNPTSSELGSSVSISTIDSDSDALQTGYAREGEEGNGPEEDTTRGVTSPADAPQPPAAMGAVVPTREQATAVAVVAADESNASRSEARETSPDRENASPEVSIKALRERAKVAGVKAKEVTEKLKCMEQLISTTHADLRRMQAVLTTAKKKEAEIKLVQETCLSEATSAREALSKSLKHRAECLKKDAAKKAQDARDLEEEMRSLV